MYSPLFDLAGAYGGPVTNAYEAIKSFIVPPTVPNAAAGVGTGMAIAPAVAAPAIGAAMTGKSIYDLLSSFPREKSPEAGAGFTPVKTGGAGTTQTQLPAQEPIAPVAGNNAPQPQQPMQRTDVSSAPKKEEAPADPKKLALANSLSGIFQSLGSIPRPTYYNPKIPKGLDPQIMMQIRQQYENKQRMASEDAFKKRELDLKASAQQMEKDLAEMREEGANKRTGMQIGSQENIAEYQEQGRNTRQDRQIGSQEAMHDQDVQFREKDLGARVSMHESSEANANARTNAQISAANARFNSQMEYYSSRDNLKANMASAKEGLKVMSDLSKARKLAEANQLKLTGEAKAHVYGILDKFDEMRENGETGYAEKLATLDAWLLDLPPETAKALDGMLGMQGRLASHHKTIRTRGAENVEMVQNPWTGTMTTKMQYDIDKAKIERQNTENKRIGYRQGLSNPGNLIED